MTAVLALPTGATEVLPPDPPRDAWLAERRKSIGGSDASTLVGLNPYGSLMALYLDKRGELPERRPTTAMDWGRRLEPVIREWLAETYNLRISVPGLIRRPDHPRLHANLDGVVLDDHGRPAAIVEIKTAGNRQAWQWADGQCPDHAELQANVGMFVAGVPECWVVGLIDGRDPQVRRVYANPAIGADIARRAAAFYTDHVDVGRPPEVDGSDATVRALRDALSQPTDGKAIDLTPRLAELLRRHAAASAAVAAAKTAAQEAEAALRLAIGDAAAIVDDHTRRADLKPSEGGRIVYATADANGTFAPKRLAETDPALLEEFTHDAPVLDVAALKAAHPDIYRRCCARPIRTRKALAEYLAAPERTS